MDDIETTINCLIHRPNFDKERTLLDNLQNIGENVYDKNDFKISELLSFGVSSNNDDASNTCIFNAAYHFKPRRFERFILVNTYLNTAVSNKGSHMIMNYFCGMVDQRKAFSFISIRDHCQGSSPSGISNTTQAGFEPAQNLSSGFTQEGCAVVMTTSPRRHYFLLLSLLF